MRNPLVLLNPYTQETLSQQIASHPGKCKEEYMAYTVYQSVFDDVTDGRQFKIYEDVTFQDALNRLGDFAEKQLMQSSGDWDIMLRSCEALTDEERGAPKR